MAQSRCRLMGRALAVLMIGLACARGAEAAALKAVALQGEASPVAGASYVKLAKRGPAIGANAGERVVFEAVANPPATKGLFAHDPDGSGSLVAQKSGGAPEGLTFKTFHLGFTNPSIDSSGTVVLAAKLKDGFGEGVYVRKAGDSSLGVVARTGDPAAGLPSGSLAEFSHSEPIGLVATTAAAFIATIGNAPTVDGLEVRQVIYACAGGDLDCHSGSGTLTPVVALGDAVDDRPGSEICRITDLAASIYGVAFRADVSSDCLTVPAVAGVFRKPLGVFAGSVATLALVGEAAAFPTSTYEQIRDNVDINNDGAVTFRARTRNTTTADQLTSQFICDPATCPAAPAAAAVSIGDPLPGGNAITRMETPRTMISDANDLAFFAKSKGPLGHQEGVYLRRADGTIETVAERGDIAPPLHPMDPIAHFSSLSNAVALSDDGRVAFAARILRTSGPRPLRHGIFAFE